MNGAEEEEAPLRDQLTIKQLKQNFTTTSCVIGKNLEYSRHFLTCPIQTNDKIPFE